MVFKYLFFITEVYYAYSYSKTIYYSKGWPKIGIIGSTFAVLIFVDSHLHREIPIQRLPIIHTYISITDGNIIAESA